MNTRSVKWLLFGLVTVLFSLVIVFAAFVVLLYEVAETAIHDFSLVVRDNGVLVWVAIGVGVVGLSVAFVAVARNN